mgnify:FL=1
MKKLIERPNISENIKATAAYEQINKLLIAVAAKDLTSDTIDRINQEIEELNSLDSFDKNFVKTIKAKENSIVKLLEKKHKIVPKNYYKKLWLALGMSTFGIPIGVAFGIAIKNMAMLGLGLPIGLAIGVLVGSNLDQKAVKEGRQLDFEAK